MDRLVAITQDFASADIEATFRAIAYKLIANSNLQLSEQNTKENDVFLSQRGFGGMILFVSQDGLVKQTRIADPNSEGWIIIL